jgi:integrase
MWALQLRCSERPAQESRNHSGLKPFVLYTLRRTALTKLGERAGGDAFVLARIAGHSSITVTQRYIHPQADAINRVFAASQAQVVTKFAHSKTPKLQPRKNLNVTPRNCLNTKD